MKIDIVTSTSKKNYDRYAKSNYEGWSQKWEDTDDIITNFYIFSEDNFEIDLDSRFKILNLFDKVPECKNFIEKNKDKKFNSSTDLKAYKTDFLKFCYKVYTLCYAVKVSDADFVIWLDSDIRVRMKKINSKVFHKGYNKKLLSYLNRENCKKTEVYNKLSSETGIIVVNNQHELKNNFFNFYQNIYDSHFIFNLAEVHDAYVFDYCISTFESKGLDIFQKLSNGTLENPIKRVFPKAFNHDMGSKK